MPLLNLADAQFTGKELWRPLNDQQLTAVCSNAQLLLFGGGSGGGKTDFLVGDAAREKDNPNLRGLLIRRSFTEMPQIIDRTRAVYSQMGATYSGADHIWRFPSGQIQPGRGAQIRLGYIGKSGDIGQYQGVPFTYLGVDESTYLLEKSVRDILPWLISTDPSLFCRGRLATNPGQVGADWHMHVFLRNKCPVHFPEESVIPGKVYRGTTWLDGKPTKLTTCFVPSLAVDNPLYGQEKLDRLASQTAENAEKLLVGCWCALAGVYFKFLRPHYRLPYAEAGEKWWHRHIIGVDYGFGGSWAAAGLYAGTESTVEFPEGRLYQVGEIVEQEMGSEDFARKIVSTFVDPVLSDGRRRLIEYAAFDPANDAHTGTGRSNLDIMSAVLQEHGIPCVKAAKDRVGNFQNLYRMLKSGQLTITDAAPMTFSSLCTRIHDPDKSGDIKKIAGDPKDDCLDCASYAANTFFSSSEKPKEVEINEKLAKYKESGMNDFSLNIYRQKFQRELSKPEEPISVGRSHRNITRK